MNKANDRYDVIYADPPWRYDFAPTRSRKIENQYPTMTTEEICKLSVPSATNAVLYLWATAPKLIDALRVLHAWGFTYKTHAVWDKESMGMGYWFRNLHELLLVGVKGKMSPPESTLRISSVYEEKRGKHSKKPEYFYKVLEDSYPELNKIELFSRNKRSNWAHWGNE